MSDPKVGPVEALLAAAREVTEARTREILTRGREAQRIGMDQALERLMAVVRSLPPASAPTEGEPVKGLIPPCPKCGMAQWRHSLGVCPVADAPAPEAQASAPPKGYEANLREGLRTAFAPPPEPVPAETRERIMAAAIRQDGVVYTGPHHHQIIRYMIALGLKRVWREQGFITSEGRYVDRTEALRLAKAAGQPPTPEWLVYANADGGLLFSEMLWSVPDSALVGEPPVPQESASTREEKPVRLHRFVVGQTDPVKCYICTDPLSAHHDAPSSTQQGQGEAGDPRWSKDIDWQASCQGAPFCVAHNNNALIACSAGLSYTAARYAKLEVDRATAALRAERDALQREKDESPSCMEAEHGGHPTCPHMEERIAILERERDEALAAMAVLEERRDGFREQYVRVVREKAALEEKVKGYQASLSLSKDQWNDHREQIARLEDHLRTARQREETLSKNLLDATGSFMREMAQAKAEGAREEREACARIAETFHETPKNWAFYPDDVARLIRARSPKGEGPKENA